MTIAKAPNGKLHIHAVISEYVKGNKTCSTIGLEYFKSQAIPIMQRSIREIYEGFPIDPEKAAKAFLDYYFTHINLCLAINPVNPLPANISETRKKIVGKSLRISRNEITRSGIVYNSFYLQTKGLADPKNSVHYHSSIQPKAVSSSIKELPIPTALFASPLPLEVNLQIFSNPNNAPNYTTHLLIRGKKNPEIIRKNGELISIHNIPAFWPYKILYRIRTYKGDGFNRWALYNDENRTFGDLAFNFGGLVYFRFNIQRKDIDPTGKYIEQRTLIFVSSAARHKDGVKHWIASRNYRTILSVFLQSAFARRLYTHEISSRLAVANGKKLN